MKKAIVLFLSIVLVMAQQGLMAQSTIGKVLKKPPKDYLKTPTGEILPANAKKIDGEIEVWVVFSDRDGNQTFTTATENAQPMKKLYFMQKCFVIEETNTHIHIVAFDDFAYDVKTKKITKNIEDLGWISKEKMLLWKHALVNAKTKFTKKALVVNQKESLKNPEKYASQKNLRIFNNPELTQENTADVRLYDFLYIYKKEGKAALLGKGLEFSAASSTSQILGWVSLDIIYEWDQRMVLEPNTMKKSVSERKLNGVEVAVFDNRSSAEKYRHTGVPDKESKLPFKDDFRTSFDPGWKRLPVIERIANDEGDIVRTGIVSAVFDTTGTDIISLDEQSKIEMEYAKQRTKARNINVVFVIDGSRAMKAYLQPAYMAIKTAMETIESDQNNENKYKWGSVVYRDYAEQKCPDGDLLLEYADLTNNGQEVVNFLSTEVIATDCMDNGGEQALYYGLSRALRMFGPYKEETNVIILIGGAGNRDKDPKVDFNTLLSKVIETQTSILAFQVMNKNGEAAYMKFQDQMQDLIVQSSERIQASYRNTYSGGKVAKKILFKEKNADSYQLDFPISSPLPGSIVWSPDGQSMEQDTLQKEILDIVRSLNNYNEELFAVADAKLKGMGKRYKINEGMLFFLSKMDVDPTLLDKSSDKNIQFFVQGYTSVKSAKLTEPLYNYCLFLDVSQLSDMIKILDLILDDNATNSELREYMANAYKEVLKSHYISSKESKKIMDSKDLKEINELIFGLPSKSDLLKGYTIDSFTSIDEYKLKEIRTYFSQKRDELYGFLNNKDNGFMSNDVLYYWVPQRLIP